MRLVAVAFLLGLSAAPALAVEQRSFVVAADDGYGVDACLSAGGECGRVVATAWCVANGFARSVEFRPQDMADITASTGTGSAPKAATLITCER